MATGVFRILVVEPILLCESTYFPKDSVLEQCNSSMSDQDIFNKCENLFVWVMRHLVCGFLLLLLCFCVQLLVAVHPSCLFRTKYCVGGLTYFISRQQRTHFL